MIVSVALAWREPLRHFSGGQRERSHAVVPDATYQAAAANSARGTASTLGVAAGAADVAGVAEAFIAGSAGASRGRATGAGAT